MAIFYLKQNDTLPVMSSTLLNSDGTAHNLTGASSVWLNIKAPSGDSISRQMTIVTAASGVVSYTFQSADWTDLELGKHRMEYEVRTGSAKQTFPNYGYDTLFVSDDIA